MDIISISCFWHQKKWSETCFTPSAVLWNMVKICPLVLKIKHTSAKMELVTLHHSALIFQNDGRLVEEN